MCTSEQSDAYAYPLYVCMSVSLPVCVNECVCARACVPKSKAMELSDCPSDAYHRQMFTCVCKRLAEGHDLPRVQARTQAGGRGNSRIKEQVLRKSRREHEGRTERP